MRVLLAMAIFCCAGFSWSADSKKTQNQVVQHQVRQEQRGTQDAPLFVYGEMIAKKDKSDAEDDAKERELRSHVDADLVKYTKYLAIFTFLLFVFTALLWLVTWRLSRDAKTSGEAQAEKMEASVKEATRAASAMEEVASATKANAVLMQGVMHQQMRAYISVDLGSATYQENTLRFAASPVLANTGFTPARKVSYWVSADILPGNTPTDFDFPVGEAKVTDVGMSPRQSYVVNGVVAKFYPDPEVAQIIKGEKKRLFVWGVVTYEDVFGGTWDTRFCHSYNFYTDREGNLVPHGIYHPSHNHAT